MQNETGRTSLAFLRRLIEVRQLGKEGNDNAVGFSFGPLHFAASLGKVDWMEELLATGAFDKDERDGDEGSTPLMWVVAANGSEELMDALVDHGASVNMQNFKGETPLFIATKLGLHDKVNYLLEYGANVHTANVDSATPLHAAAALGDTDLISTLVKYSAHVNVGDEEGDTPLHWAIREGHEKAACLLVHYGADINLANEDGESALEFALNLNETNLARSLAHVFQNGLIDATTSNSFDGAIFPVDLELDVVSSGVHDLSLVSAPEHSQMRKPRTKSFGSGAVMGASRQHVI